jgi:hypothetical protein
LQLISQLGYVAVDHTADDVLVDVEVATGQHHPKAKNLAPGDLGVALPDLFGDA